MFHFDLGATLGFVIQNWMQIVALGGFVYTMFTSKKKDEVAAAQKQAFDMAINAVKLAGEQTIENKDKRQWAINTVLEAMPDNVKKHVDAEQVGQLVEKAWLTIVRPNL